MIKKLKEPLPVKPDNDDEIIEAKQSYVRFKNIPKSKQDEILKIIYADRKIKSDKVDRQGRKITFEE